MSKAIRVSQEVLAELDKRYPSISPHQAIRHVLGLPATERRARRVKSRIRKVMDAIMRG